MLNSLDAALHFQEQALKVHSQRQQLIASNIANADTPNYKAADINFADALRNAQSGIKKTVVLQTTAPGHIAPAQQGSSFSQVVYSTASQPAADGNTVEMDAERARFADNAVRYETAFRFLNQQIKGLLAAIQG